MRAREPIFADERLSPSHERSTRMQDCAERPKRDGLAAPWSAPPIKKLEDCKPLPDRLDNRLQRRATTLCRTDTRPSLFVNEMTHRTQHL